MSNGFDSSNCGSWRPILRITKQTLVKFPANICSFSAFAFCCAETRVYCSAFFSFCLAFRRVPFRGQLKRNTRTWKGWVSFDVRAVLLKVTVKDRFLGNDLLITVLTCWRWLYSCFPKLQPPVAQICIRYSNANLASTDINNNIELTSCSLFLKLWPIFATFFFAAHVFFYVYKKVDCINASVYDVLYNFILHILRSPLTGFFFFTFFKGPPKSRLTFEH